MSSEGKALLDALASGRLAATDAALAEALRATVAELFGSVAMWARREGHDGAALLALLPVVDANCPDAANDIRRTLAIGWAGASEVLGHLARGEA